MAYGKAMMKKTKQSGKSKAKMRSHSKPKAKTMDNPGASVVKKHTSPRGRERRLMGRTF